MTVIDFNTIEHDVTRKPVPTFRHHALAAQPAPPHRIGGPSNYKLAAERALRLCCEHWFANRRGGGHANDTLGRKAGSMLDAPSAPLLKQAGFIGGRSPLAFATFPRKLARLWRLGDALDFGIVGVDAGAFSDEGAPSGGVKRSDIGREASRQGIEELTEIKYLRVGDIE